MTSAAVQMAGIESEFSCGVLSTIVERRCFAIRDARLFRRAFGVSAQTFSLIRRTDNQAGWQAGWLAQTEGFADRI